jgi:hypothetical protein
VGGPYFAEAIGLARALDDRWRLSQILARPAIGAVMAGDPIADALVAEKHAIWRTRSGVGSTRVSVARTSGGHS